MVEQYITWLNERGFHPDDLEFRGFNGNTPLLLAALEGNAMMVSRLIEAGTDLYAVNDDFNGVLFNACYAASPEVIRLLVEAGADINDTNEEGQRHSCMPHPLHVWSASKCFSRSEQTQNFITKTVSAR